MLRVEGANVEDLIQRSYRQFQSEKAIPMLEQKRASRESQMKDIVIDDEHLIQSYAGLLDQYHVLEKARRDMLMRPKLVLPFLQPGRLILIEHGGMQAESSRPVNYADARHGAWAAVINFEVLGKKEEKEKRRVIIDVLAMCDEAQGPKDPRILPSQEGANGVAFVVTIDLDQVLELSTIRVHLPADLRTKETRAVGAKVLKEVAKRFGTKGPPLLDAEKDIKVTSDDYFATVARLDKIKRMIDSHPVLEDEQGTLLLVYRHYEKRQI
eukprot:jgi/Picre1/31091/NNA_006446.t1